MLPSSIPETLPNLYICIGNLNKLVNQECTDVLGVNGLQQPLERDRSEGKSRT